MKHALIAVFCISMQVVGFSQEAESGDTQIIYSDRDTDREVNTLFASDQGFGGHLSLNIKATEIKNTTALLLGGELVFSFSHALNIGIAGYGMPTLVEYADTDYGTTDNLNVELGYGGLFIEPIFFDSEVVHFTVPILTGVGWSGITNRGDFSPNDPDLLNLYEQSLFFVFEPGINIEVNLVKHVRFFVGGSYRFANGSNLEHVSDRDLSGFTAGGGFRVGWF